MMGDSTEVLVRVVNDSLRVLIPLTSIRVDDRLAWLPAAVGGILAVGAGIVTEIYREWRRDVRIRRRLAREVLTISKLIEEIVEQLPQDPRRARAVSDEIHALRAGYDGSRETLTLLLDPPLLRDVHAWYLRLRHFCQGVTARVGSFEMASMQLDADAEVLGRIADGLLDGRGEATDLLASGRRIAAELSATFSPRGGQDGTRR